ncbi:hypothetical protein F4818DRAFT_125659 [Hypoxylon cercidicola]|nr:hypothetical protein F4818DRAFT_125659 [Hypoxylon cercidicola]
MRSVTLTAALSLAAGAIAARVCGTNSSSTYPWTVGDGRYDGADPSVVNGTATVAFSIMPSAGSGYSTFFECMGEWPEAWGGYFEGGDKLIWGDCIWAGNGPNSDATVSFALDWKNRTMYLSHTFACSDIEGSDALALGSTVLDLACAASADGAESCMLDPALPAPKASITTRGGPAHVSSGAACADDAAPYQSWQLERWTRRYALAPGSTTPSADSGPAFTLRNMANRDVFACAPGPDSAFRGDCAWAGEGDSTSATTAAFTFDPEMDLLTITQTWICSDSPSYDAVGIGFVQATCTRAGDQLTCTSGPLWIGTDKP